MAFLSIHVAPGLDPRARRRAIAAGPVAVALRSAHDRLLRSAGFTVLEERDLTAEFAATARAWLRGSEARAADLAPLFPPGGFDDRQRERRRQLAAIEAGLLRRSLLVAVRRGRALTSGP